MKITISGWPGAGGTTLCLILAYELNLQYLSVGSIFRKLGNQMAMQNTGKDRFIADEINEEKYGKMIDDRVAEVLLNSNKRLIIDSDITAIRVGKRKEYFSIFLTAGSKERKSRLSVDGRESDVDVLTQRDNKNRKFYKDLFGIDWFSIDLIEKTHNLMIDNSNVGIAGELKIILERLATYFPEDTDMINTKLSNTDMMEKEYWDRGKDWYINYFKKNELLFDIDEILKHVK